MISEPLVTAIVLAWGTEPWLEASVEAILDSRDVEVEVLLVDNGCADGAVERLRSRGGVIVLSPGRNLGFAGGCNLAAHHARGEILVLVNSDAIVKPDAIARLVKAVGRAGVGMATASIRLADDSRRLNSGGNVVHFLGFSWAGRFGELAPLAEPEAPVTAASGACMAIRRSLWEALEGFNEDFFAYYEDAELSLRCWHRGLSVVYVPGAVALHRYEFSRNPLKYYLAERNRLLMILTTYPSRTLVAVAPALVVVETLVVGASVVGGWWREKLKGWSWLIRHHEAIRARRARVQRDRRVSDRQLAPLFVSRLDPGNYPLPELVGLLGWWLRGYWALVRRFL